MQHILFCEWFAYLAYNTLQIYLCCHNSQNFLTFKRLNNIHRYGHKHIHKHSNKQFKSFYIYSPSSKYLGCLLILIMMNNATLNRVVAFTSLQDTDFVFIGCCLSYFLIAVIETPLSKQLRVKGSILTPSSGEIQSIAVGNAQQLSWKAWWQDFLVTLYLHSGSRKWWVNTTTAHFPFPVQLWYHPQDLNQCNQYNSHRDA